MPDRDELVLVTWNVRYFGHATGGLYATPESKRQVARALAELPAPPDVICLQEVEDASLRGGLGPGPQIDRFLAALNAEVAPLGRRYHARYFPAHRYELRGAPPLYTTGLAVLLAEPLTFLDTEAHEITHRRFAWAPLKQRRIVGHARVGLPSGAAFDVYNAHLSLPAFLTADVHRLHERMGYGENQVAEIATALGFVGRRNAELPSILVGDFNALPGSPVYEAVVAAGLIDGFARWSGLEVEALRRWPTHGLGRLRQHLDYVFSCPRVRWHDFEATHAWGTGGRFDGISDHNPKVGRFSLAA